MTLIPKNSKQIRNKLYRFSHSQKTTQMKKVIYIISLAFLTATATAQEKRDSVFTQDVNIVREYVPTIKDAGKINTLPAIEKPEPIEKNNVKYSTWASPLSADFDLQTLPSATLKKMRPNTLYREGYARIGAGNYTSFLGDLYLPLLKGKDYRLDFSANHLSTFGKVKLEDDSKVKAKNMDNMAQLAFNKNFFKVDLFSDIKFERRDFNYYGLDSISSTSYIAPGITGSDITLDKDAHNMLDFRIGILSRPKPTGLNYGITMKYELTNTASKLNENHLATKAFISTNWDIDQLGLGLSLDNFFYNKPDSTIALFSNVTTELDNYSVLGLTPYYTFKRETWDLKLGLKAFFSINKGQAVSVTPDIMGNIALVRDIFYLYGGITGDLKMNSMRAMFNENQYLRPDVHVDETYTPLDAYAGLKVKLFDYMVFNGFAGYKYIDNQYFFVNHITNPANGLYDNTFDVVTDEARLFNAGASITYNWNKTLGVLLKGVYNKWNLTDEEFAWHKPDWQIDLDVNYKINGDIKVSANALMLGKRHAKGYMGEAVDLKPVFDISLSGVYEYASWLSFFLNLNNIFAQNYQIWYGYNSQRFNAMAGAAFSF